MASDIFENCLIVLLALSCAGMIYALYMLAMSV